jgi:hypothetical protein
LPQILAAGGASVNRTLFAEWSGPVAASEDPSNVHFHPWLAYSSGLSHDSASVTFSTGAMHAVE